MKKVRVGVLGATGMVGQMFVHLLEEHPFFELTELAASSRSAGKTYGEVVQERWKASKDIPECAKNMIVKECVPDINCELVFSALDPSTAGEIEQEFAKAGYIVASNSKNHRMHETVPLLVPEVNPEHLKLVKYQNFGKGFIVTNPNCSVIGLVMVLAPLHKQFGVKQVIVTTMQALSGAGYPGVAGIDILDNVIPFIEQEEEKIETEIPKLLGELEDGKIKFADVRVSAHCNRVNVSNGHLEAVSVKLSKKATKEEFIKCLENYNPLLGLDMPSSPAKPIIVSYKNDRPQPKLDRELGNGMSVVVGRIRECLLLDYKFIVLSHNLIRGAAGASILNAELMYKKGLIKI